MPNGESSLAGVLNQLAALGTEQDREQLLALLDRLDASRLRVLVAGEAKRGKSREPAGHPLRRGRGVARRRPDRAAGRIGAAGAAGLAVFLVAACAVPALIYLAGRPRAAGVSVPVWDGGMVSFRPRMQ